MYFLTLTDIDHVTLASYVTILSPHCLCFLRQWYRKEVCAGWLWMSGSSVAWCRFWKKKKDVGRQGWWGEQTFLWAKFSSEQCAASESKGNSLLGAIFPSGKVDDFSSSWNTDIRIKIKSKFYITIKTTKEGRKRSCVRNWDNSSNWAVYTNGSNGRWSPLILPREASYCKEIYKVTEMLWTTSCQAHPIPFSLWGLMFLRVQASL